MLLTLKKDIRYIIIYLKEKYGKDVGKSSKLKKDIRRSLDEIEEEKCMKVRKFFAGVVTFVMVLSTISMGTCLAYDDGALESGTVYSGSFASAWQKVFRDAKHDTVITYGFNTVAIDEDYCYATQSAKLHYAEIYNGNGYHYGPFKAAGKSSNLEVTHSGTRIQYHCCW